MHGTRFKQIRALSRLYGTVSTAHTAMIFNALEKIPSVLSIILFLHASENVK